MSVTNPPIEKTLLLIRKIRQSGGNISAANGKLKLELPKNLNNPEFLQELRLHKSNILSLLSEDIEPAPLTTQIPTVNREESMPLSYGQERFWVLEKINDGDSPLHVPFGMRLKGELSLDVLEQSFQKLMERHEALRTGFLEKQMVPYATVATELDFHLDVCDISNQSTPISPNHHPSELREFLHRPFDLSQPPLMRACVFQESTHNQVLVVVLHHMVADGWSLGIFIDELAEVYNKLKAHIPLDLSDLPIQYLDYVAWQQSDAQKEKQEQDLAFWLDSLASLPPVLELPTDYVRPNKSTYEGKNLPFRIEPTVFRKLEQLSQQEGVTLFAVLQTAMQVLLYRYTQQEDFAIGTAVANRSRLEVERLVGLFINMLALPAHVTPDNILSDLLQTTQQSILAAMSHPETPFERLVEEINPERQAGVNPLYQVLLILQNADFSVPQFTELSSEFIELDTDTAMLDLTFELQVDEGALLGLVDYNSTVFKEDTVTRMITHYKVILSALCENLELSVNDIQILNEDEYDIIINQWSQTGALPTSTSCTHQKIELQAENRPNAVAVMHEDQSLTYKQLNEKANQLAHHLIELGINSDDLVGLYLTRSLDMIVAVLGILKAGGAYLPLDPAYPDERLQFMVDDAQPKIILIQEGKQFDIPSNVKPQIVNLSNWTVFSKYSQENPKSNVSLDHLAYIIYTSGSTGKPKGVQIEHGSLDNFVQAAISDYGMNQEDRLLQFATIAFDTAVEEIFCTLTAGGTLVLRTDEMLSSMKLFLDTCSQWGITILDLPTAFWHELTIRLHEDKLTLPKTMRLVIIGGEKANFHTMIQWSEAVGSDIVLLNTYGPTESTVVATLYEAHKTAPVKTVSNGMLIGRPYSNYLAYILDTNLQPVPIGVSGELFIGGPSLARGYLNRPELTAEKFIPNPFGEGRLYRTGDVVRYLSDGNIEFMGRNDDQVKIRGFRIEPGEIEAVLVQHPSVAQAVVIVREDEPGEKALAAYLLPDTLGSDEDTNDLLLSSVREFLNGKLPNFMRPSSIVVMTEFPMTPSGKVNKRALPKPDKTLRSTDSYVAPRNDLEEAIAAIWAESLRIPQIGISDDFFALGGHSLVAIQIVGRIRDELNVDVAMGALFQMPTISELAQHIAAKQYVLESETLLDTDDTDEQESFVF